MNERRNFLVKALQNELDYWEDPPAVVTPTEAPASPQFFLLGGPVQHTGGPPGLSTPRADADAPQEFVQQGAASSSRPAAGGTEFYRLDFGQNVEPNAGGDRQAPREDVGDGEMNLLEGRTCVRAERDARG